MLACPNAKRAFSPLLTMLVVTQYEGIIMSEQMAEKTPEHTDVLLLGPGPSGLELEVASELSRPPLGYQDPVFREVLADVQHNLRSVMQTSNRWTCALAGTGSTGMEACFVNLLEPETRVLVLVNGLFGSRMSEVAQRLGAKVDVVEFEWGNAIDIATVKTYLKRQRFEVVAMVHAETSTGVANPVIEVGRLARKQDALFLVDVVTSLGGMPVALDDWGVDAAYSASQKCLSCPGGVAPVSFSDKAMEHIRQRKQKVPNWCLDMSLISRYWDDNDRAYHHTPPANLLFALDAGLRIVIREGLDSRWQRYREMHYMLVDGLRELGLSLLSRSDCQLPMLSAVCVPQGIDGEAVSSRLRREFNIEIGNGLGPLAGKIWRVGLMGTACSTVAVQRLLDALAIVLPQHS